MNSNTSFDSNPPIQTSAYDEFIKLFCGAYEPLFTMAYAALRASIGDDAKVLVVGAGTGMEICTFAPLSPGWRMMGVDPSANMLSVARQRIDGAGLQDNASLFQGYTHELPEDELYDAATCILVMHFLADDGAKLNLLRSIGERLQRGAPLVLVDGFGAPGSAQFEHTLEAWKTFPVAMGVDPTIVEDAFNNTILRLIKFVPEPRIATLLNEAGFAQPSRFFTSFLYGGWITTKR